MTNNNGWNISPEQRAAEAKDVASQKKIKIAYVVILAAILIPLLLFNSPYSPLHKESSVSYGMSREQVDRMKAQDLIDNDDVDIFLESCEENTSEKTREAMAKRCGCEFNVLANVAETYNKKFSDVISDSDTAVLLLVKERCPAT
ncbi:hypothetical protein H0V99_02255 [Candidatus Saccharibacteria bacterium]|nr:hypothetical protein [Candidatus Saccharibacteria bacterium]